ncbi:hypothetical protein [Pseudomonas extremaustralis]|uniref:Uncharacterized protein n=1 Tax=Pseudomonas extremaustralis TaxID=359110 RepID=A0A5C5QB47_9PSED|nr:hypothetical protein [Pseudomonas extremaustralis]EZI23140.1 hypothetical protein PE143B_0130765 [Pseudomonas extremaustralis 14-3 substr. 14-3b]TWS02848.1 hypothetical protein FIV36_17990 [Pseudomonas extremaustralis]SDE69424.1 hypothetical protein SAMN05216591_0642 [Pseudomonas extremaustralis]
MSQENVLPRTAADLRTIAHAAPTAKIEREELAVAQQQAERERIAKLGGSAELVLDLEARLAAAVDDRKRAQVEANYANRKLEQVFESVSAAVGRDVRQLSLVHFGMALTASHSKLVTLAGYIDKARTLDDLVVLKRVASNLGVIQPQTMAQTAQLMGLSHRRAV